MKRSPESGCEAMPKLVMGRPMRTANEAPAVMRRTNKALVAMRTMKKAPAMRRRLLNDCVIVAEAKAEEEERRFGGEEEERVRVCMGFFFGLN